MTQLHGEKCVACRRDSPSVTADDIAQLKPEVSDWELVDDAGIPKLDRISDSEISSRHWPSPTPSETWPNRKGIIPS